MPRLLALSEHHEEAAAALRVIFAASPAAVASRDVFRSMDALLRQLPSSMFTSAASVEAELSVISQLRSIICTRRSSCEELGNVGGAVACNSFIVLGGVRSLIACFNSNLCANKVPIHTALQPPPFLTLLMSTVRCFPNIRVHWQLYQLCNCAQCRNLTSPFTLCCHVVSLCRFAS